MTKAATPNWTQSAPVKAQIDPRWRPLLEEICALKYALDHAFRWHGDGGNENWINDVLRRYGLSLQDFEVGTGEDGPHFPQELLEMLLGSEFRVHSINPVTRLMQIPPWAVLGWVRKSPYKMTPSLTKEELKHAAHAANQWDGSEAYTHRIARGAPGIIQKLCNLHHCSPYMCSAQR